MYWQPRRFYSQRQKYACSSEWQSPSRCHCQGYHSGDYWKDRNRGGQGHVIEYEGECIRDLSMEGRMTICNMSIEAGARAGLISPDEKPLHI